MTQENSSSSHGPVLKLARLLFGGILAFMAVDNFRNREALVGYAESKAVPRPDLAVPAASGSLLFGGLGVALWRLPSLASVAAATFFAGVTPEMHDFWNAEDTQDQQIHFLKNFALLGGALSFLALALRSRGS